MASLIVEQLGIELFPVLSTCNGTYDELVRFCNSYHLLQSFFVLLGWGLFQRVSKIGCEFFNYAEKFIKS